MPPIQPPNQPPQISIPPPAQPQPAPAPVVVPIQPSITINWPKAIAAGALALFLALGGLLLVVVAIIHYGGFWPNPNPVPSSVDFVKLGRNYVKPLGAAYAPAWHGGAADIRAGKPLADVTKGMVGTWENQRGEIFKKFIRPELSKIVPEGTPDAQIAPAQRAALADAYDGIAKGLETGP